MSSEEPVLENGPNGSGAQTGEDSTSKEMKAVVLNSFGGLKSVKVLNRPEPSLLAGQVLIRVKACGLNFQDLMVRQGAVDSAPKTPFIMGFECAGEVDKVNEGEEKFRVGDRVLALPEYKAWAELVAVPTEFVFSIPDEMSFRAAVGLGMNYVVAHTLLFEMSGLSEGKNVLLHSAGGGVGFAVAQLCKTINDVKVLGVASKCKHEALEPLIDHLIERGADYPSEVHKVSPEGVDIVLDCLCGEECNRSYSLLKPMGKYILYGSSNVVTGETKSLLSAARSWWQVDKVSPIRLFDENKTIAGFNLRHLLHHQNGSLYVSKVIGKVIELWKNGQIKPVIDSVWALEDAHPMKSLAHWLLASVVPPGLSQDIYAAFLELLWQKLCRKCTTEKILEKLSLIRLLSRNRNPLLLQKVQKKLRKMKKKEMKKKTKKLLQKARRNQQVIRKCQPRRRGNLFFF